MILAALYILYAVAVSVALARAGQRGSAERAAGGRLPARVKVLVIGATGGTGRQLVRQALDRGHTVTVLVRSPHRFSVDESQVAVLQGDVLDAASVDAAVRGQDVVLCALGHRRYLGPSRILSDGTTNIIKAMRAHHVSRLVCETSLGLGDSAWRMGLYYTLFVIPVVLPFYFWDKTRQERAVAHSHLDWVIVRPAALTDGERSGRARADRKVGGLVLTPRISRADVADFMLSQIHSDTHVGQAVGVSS